MILKKWWVDLPIPDKTHLLEKAKEDGECENESIYSLNLLQVKLLFKNYYRADSIQTSLKKSKTKTNFDINRYIEKLSDIEKVKLIQDIDKTLNKSFINKVANSYKKNENWKKYIKKNYGVNFNK